MITFKIVLYILVCAISEVVCLCKFDKAGMFFPDGVIDADLMDWCNALWSALATMAVVLIVGIVFGVVLCISL